MNNTDHKNSVRQGDPDATIATKSESAHDEADFRHSKRTSAISTKMKRLGDVLNRSACFETLSSALPEEVLDDIDWREAERECRHLR